MLLARIWNAVVTATVAVALFAHTVTTGSLPRETVFGVVFAAAVLAQARPPLWRRMPKRRTTGILR